MVQNEKEKGEIGCKTLGESLEWLTQALGGPESGAIFQHLHGHGT
jgi:hypothetical protein